MQLGERVSVSTGWRMEISAAVKLNVGSLFSEDNGSSILKIVCGIRAVLT